MLPGGLLIAASFGSSPLSETSPPLGSGAGWAAAIPAGTTAYGGLTIYANGSLSDPAAPISIEGSTYTLTGPLHVSLRDERNGSRFDGGHFSIAPPAASPFAVEVLNASDVIVRNVVTAGGAVGIRLLGAVNATVSFARAEGAATGVAISNSGPVALANLTVSGAEVGLAVDRAHAVSVAGARVEAATWAVDAASVVGLEIGQSDLRGAGLGAVRVIGATDLSIDRCDLSAPTRSSALGLNVSGSTGVTITASRADATSVGFAIYGSGQVLLSGDRAEGAGTAVDLRSDEYVTVTGGDFRSAGGAGSSSVAIRGDQLMEFAFTDNDLTGSEGTGIAVAFGTHGTLTGNNVSGADRVGFAVSASHNLQVTDNVADGIRAVGAFGFLFRENGRLDFYRNHAVGDYTALADTLSNRLWVVDSNLSYPIASGIVTHNDRELQIRTSEVLGAPAGSAAIDIGQGITTLLSANSVNASAGTGLRAVECLDLTLAGNYAVGTAGPGIEISDGSEVQVTGNWVGRTPGTAIRLEGLVNLTATSNRVFDSGVGIELIAGVAGVLADNNASANAIGFSARNSTATAWTSNDLFANAVSFLLPAGSGDAVYHNNFVADGGFLREGAPGAAASPWDGGYPLGGNYWSNWTGPDAYGGAGQNLSGPDGIVDAPLGPGGSPIDRYPLAAPWTFTLMTFVARGLPPGVSWGVDFNGSRYLTTAASLAVPETNGAYTPYAYQAIAPTGYHSPNGTGHGQLCHQSLTTYLWFSPSAPQYGVAFVESGLPTGASWSVRLGTVALRGTTASLSAAVTNGSYEFSVPSVPGYRPQPFAGTIVVAGGNVSVPVAFAPFLFPIEFTASGRPPATFWTVSVGSTRETTTETALAFDLANGTYSFAVDGPAGLVPVPDHGVLRVSGSPVSVHVEFVTAVYPLTFLGDGLPTAASWAVVVDGVAHPVTGVAWSASFANGTYSYAVVPPAGYRADPSGGTVTIDGALATVVVAFHLPLYLVTFLASGRPPGGPWTVVIDGQATAGTTTAVRTWLPNGTYPFEVVAAGVVPQPDHGTLTVSGAGVVVPVAFVPRTTGSSPVVPALGTLALLGTAVLAGAATAGALAYLASRRLRPPTPSPPGR